MPDDSAPSTKYFSPASVERGVVAMERGQDVERQAHQLEAEIERDQVGGRDHHQHAERREHDQHRKFEALLPLRAWRNRSTTAMAAAEPISARIFRNRAKSSTTKLPLKLTSLPAGSSSRITPAATRSTIAPPSMTGAASLVAKAPEHQQQPGADAEDDLRQQRQERRRRSERRSSPHLAHRRGLHGGRARAGSCPISCVTEAADRSSTGFG